MFATYDPLSLPPRRFHPGACGVCLSTRHLKPCTKCFLISYCSEIHRTLDYQYHEPFCKICSTFGNTDRAENGRMKGRQDDEFCAPVSTEQDSASLTAEKSETMLPSVGYKTLFFEIGLDSKYLQQPQELLKWKDQMIFEIGCLLKRNLDSFEMQMLLFPKICSVCLNDNPYELMPCPDCHSVFFCHLHRDDLNKHKQEKFFDFQFQPCRHVPLSQTAPHTTTGEIHESVHDQESCKSDLQWIKSNGMHVNAATTSSLCVMQRRALECDRKEQLLGIENVDEILTPYFNQARNCRSILNEAAGTFQCMTKLFGNVDISATSDKTGSQDLKHISNKANAASSESSVFPPPVGDISRLLLSDPLSFPLTIVNTVKAIQRQRSQSWLHHNKKFVIHVVGAEAHRELLGLTRWEIIQHELPEMFNDIEFIFIGASLECDLDEGKVESEEDEENSDGREQETETAADAKEKRSPTPSSVLYYQKKFGYWDKDRCYISINGRDGLSCDHCQLNNKRSVYRIFPCMSYEEFVNYWSAQPQQSTTGNSDNNNNLQQSFYWTVPDLVVAFNCGFHVAMDDVEVWDSNSLKYLVQNNPNVVQAAAGASSVESHQLLHAPLLFTSLNLSECQQDLSFLQSTLLQHNSNIDVLLPPSPNCFSSLRPVRDASGADSIYPTIYVSNAATCLVALSR